MPFSFDGATLKVTVKCDVNALRSFGETEYYVTVVKAKGGRKDGKGRKDPLGLTITVPAHVVVIKITLFASTLRASALCILTELCIVIIFIS